VTLKPGNLEEAGDRGQETGGRRQEAGGRRQEAGDSPLWPKWVNQS